MNNSIKKVVVVAVILLFVSVGVISSTGNTVIEKHVSTENFPSDNSVIMRSGLSLITIKVEGEIGENEWYVSDVTFTITYESDEIDAVFYRINGGEWIENIEPFVVSDDGQHVLEWYSVNYGGNPSEVDDPFSFKIDKTAPTVELLWESPDNVHVDFTAICGDATSGTNRCEFFIWAFHQFTDYAEPYEWTIKWSPRLRFVTFFAYVYDDAGNSNFDLIESGEIAGCLRSSISSVYSNKRGSSQSSLSIVSTAEIVGKEKHVSGENNFGYSTEVAWHGPGTPYDPENRINPQLTSADYDMDGDIDFLVGDNSGKVEFYKNNGSGDFTSAGIIHDFGHTSWGVTSVDHDEDGDIDFLVAAETEIGSFYGHVYLKRNKMVESNYSTCFEPGPGEIIIDYSGPNSGSLTSLDYNNDGDIDFIIGFYGSMYLCMKKENFYEPFFISSPDGTGDLREGGLTTVDYDNDGYDDIVAGGNNGVVRVFINSRCHAIFTRPLNCYWYKFDEEQYPIFKDEGVLVVGKLTVEVKELEEIEKVEFYVDRWLREIDTTPPYSFSWTWRPILLFKIRHTLKIVAFDSDGNHSSEDEIFPVWRFL